ncbi:MAG: hypothetical protein OQL09_08690 [Gammaproteobacteria bacterium]|nr:hypothetical protein [Gammaproteobacteria bacterium]
MKQLFITIILLLSAASYAGQKAITDTGKEVILKDDGTWQYSANTKNAAVAIKANKNTFKRSKEASFLLKSVKNNSAFWLNTSKWAFKKATDNAEAEYQFQLKGQDLYGMAITEGIEIALDPLTDLALINAQSADPNARIVAKEYRNVNGRKVIYMEMNAVIQSIDFTYLGYYYSDSSGSTQLLTYTATNLINKYKPEIYKLLNGLVTQ